MAHDAATAIAAARHDAASRVQKPRRPRHLAQPETLRWVRARAGHFTSFLPIAGAIHIAVNGKMFRQRKMLGQQQCSCVVAVLYGTFVEVCAWETEDSQYKSCLIRKSCRCFLLTHFFLPWLIFPPGEMCHDIANVLLCIFPLQDQLFAVHVCEWEPAVFTCKTAL